jgi:hypothetical protein
MKQGLLSVIVSVLSATLAGAGTASASPLIIKCQGDAFNYTDLIIKEIGDRIEMTAVLVNEDLSLVARDLGVDPQEMQGEFKISFPKVNCQVGMDKHLISCGSGGSQLIVKSLSETSEKLVIDPDAVLSVKTQDARVTDVSGTQELTELRLDTGLSGVEIQFRKNECRVQESR